MAQVDVAALSARDLAAVVPDPIVIVDGSGAVVVARFDRLVGLWPEDAAAT